MNPGEPFISQPSDHAAGSRPGQLALEPGRRVGPFTIDTPIGQGGMATVYRARQAEPHRFVALKVIRADHAADPAYRQRFLDEAETLAALEHPSIVPIYAAGEADGVLYIAMRLVDGPDLQARIASDGRLTLVETVRALEPIADAIDYVHSMGIVHRDLKPSNIVIDRAGRPYLTDLGVGTRVDSLAGATDAMAMGTLDYMAPEQFTVGADPALAPATDLYALGCVAYACLTGRPPFARSVPGDPTRAEVERARAREAPPSVRLLLPESPEQLDQVLARALAHDPRARFLSARAFVAALASVARAPVTTPPRLATEAAEAPAPPAAPPPGLPTAIAARPAPAATAVPMASTGPPLGKAQPRRPTVRTVALRASVLALLATVAVTAGAAFAPGGGATDGGEAKATAKPGVAAGAGATTKPPKTPAPTARPTPAAPPYPNADEARLLALQPSDIQIGACTRADDKDADALAMVSCPAPDGQRKHLFFALYSDTATMTDDYSAIVRRHDLAGETQTRCADDTQSNHPWRYADDAFFVGQRGVLACYPRTENGFDGIQYVWTHDDIKVIGFWLAPDYQTGMDYVESWLVGARS